MSQGGQQGRQDKLISKPSKVMTQAKLESLYGNKITRKNDCSYKSYLDFKTDSSKDCVIVEKGQFSHNLPRRQGVSTFAKAEEEDKGLGNTLRPKRSHIEISSPRYDHARSPSSNEEANADVSGNGFVTAREKLV